MLQPGLDVGDQASGVEQLLHEQGGTSAQRMLTPVVVLWVTPV